MKSRKDIHKGALGDYCELIVAAAFIAAGAEVGLPFGNQFKWDMVVRESEDSEWITVQVKTIPMIKNGNNPCIGVHRQNKAHSPYTSSDIKLLVAVHPETGTIWRVPIEDFAGTRRVKLHDKYIWHGNVVREATPMVIDRQKLEIKRVVSIRKVQAIQRQPIFDSLPTERPHDITQSSWGMMLEWVSGRGYKIIGAVHGTTPMNVRARVIRVLRKCGAKNLPPSFLTAKLN